MIKNLREHKLIKHVHLDPASQRIYTPIARERAIAATLGFGSFGVIAAATMVHNWALAWPLVLFYAILVANTYFSVRVFSTITPAGNTSQRYIDFLITLTYLSLATQFDHPLWFSIIATLLFLECIVKYKILIDIAPRYKDFLNRKIVLDWLGALLCSLATLGIVMNYIYGTTVLFALIKAVANIYLLAIKPFYILDI